MSDYYQEGYQDRCDELNKLEGEIIKKTTELRSIGKSGSTVSIEREIENLLKDYNSKLFTFKEKYRSPPNEMPPSVVNKRKAQLETFSLNYDRISRNYNEAKRQKYAMDFVPQGMSEETKNETRFMNNQQLFEHQKYKLNQQDEQIEEITKKAVLGTKIAKEMHHDVENQNEKLGELDNNVNIFFFNIFLF